MVCFLILLLVNTLAFLPVPSASEGTVFTDISHPTNDSWVGLAQPHYNHGAEWEIHVKTSCDTIRRAYLKFDLGVIPADGVIVSAKLYLYCVEADPKANVRVNIHGTRDNWNEHTITWNNAPPVGAPVASSTTVDRKNKFYSWDITPYAQSEHNSDKTLSVIVKFPVDDPVHPELNPQYERFFASKEIPPKHKRPYLKIAYVKPPVASFTYSPSAPFAYEIVTFDASASYDPNGYIVRHAWNFGDGNSTTVTDPVITHVYTDCGNFAVTLTVTDNDGLTDSTTAMVTVSSPAILRVSLPTGKIVGPNPDPWLNEGWLLNLTGLSLTFRVRVGTTSHAHMSYDTHLVIALDDVGYDSLVNLTVDGITIPKAAFQYGIPKPYGIWTWPDDVYPTWFSDTYVNLGTIPPKRYKEVGVSATFSDLATVRIHLDAYGKVILDTPTRVGQIAWSPHSEDSTVLFQPRPPPLSVSISPTSVVMDVGQFVTFDSSVSGGTRPYTYQWYLDHAPVPSATAPTWAFFPTSSGTYEVYLIVADGSDHAESNHVIVTVNPPLAVSISPVTVVVDVGRSVMFRSTVSGGTPPYAYQWYLNDVAVLDAMSSDWTFTPTSTGFYTVYVNVVDYVGATAKSNVASVTVSPELSVCINPVSAAMNLGSSKTFTSSVSGGTAPYTYQWYLNGTAVLDATFDSWTFTPTAIGSYIVYLNVTDSADVTAKSNNASVTVNQPLEVSIVPTSVVMDVSQSVTFDSSVSGGTPPYGYQWYLDYAPLLSATDQTLTLTPTSAGTYEVYVIVADSSDPAESNHAIVTVNPPLAVSISPLSVVMDVGQSQTFTSSVLGGTPSYTYRWYVDGTPVGTAPSWAFTPISPGSYGVYLNITDAVSVTTKSNIALVAVNPALTISISPATVTMDVGQSQLFTSTVSGGTPHYAYQWYLDDIAVLGATSRDWSFTPTSTGSYTIYLNVTDYVDVTAKSNVASVTVNPGLSVSINPISATMTLGDSKTFTSSVSGGTPPYIYQWYVEGVPVLGAIASTWAFTPTATGSYTIYLYATDSVGVAAQSNVASVTVNPLPLPLSVSISPTSVVMDVGQSVTFDSSVSGGTPPYTCQWYIDDAPIPGAIASTWAFTSTSPGTYEVYLNVTDSVSVTANSDIALVNVNPSLSVSISPISITMGVGESQLFTSTVSGGTLPYTYQWYLNGTAVPGEISSSWMFTSTSLGFYLVHLRVTDYVDMSAESDSASVTVRELPKLPKAAFTYSPLYPYVNETVTFDASASTPDGGVISEYTWHFGDENITTVTNPIITHAYAAEGDYEVTLVVTDSEGLEDSTSQIMTVYLPLLYSMGYTAHHLGEEFLINVVVVNITHLYSFEFKLGYNTTLLDAINVTEGSFLKSLGSTSATMEIHEPEGYVLINVALLAPAPPAEGSGILATIKFRVTHATVYPETVRCGLDLYDTNLSDPAGEPIPHTVHDGSYEFVPFPPCIGPAIDVYTQKPDPYSGKGPNTPSDAFGPQEEVILYAYVSYNCEPVQNKLVVFEVKNPNDEPVIFRTATSNAEGVATSSFRIPWEAEEAESLFGEWTIFGSVEITEQKGNDTCTFKFGWLIEITHVKTADTYGNLKTSFTKGEHIHFNITVKNIAFTSKIATLTIVVYDECDVPIGHVVLHDWSISPGTTEIFIIDLQIPKWAYVGIGTVYVNAYTDLPRLCGTPYCPEVSTTFMIMKP